MNKEKRLKVYNKFGGRCAYCGKEIEYKDMQVDHIKPKCQGGTDNIDNLFPTCRLCNHYKRECSPQVYKEWKLSTLTDKLRKIYIFRVAERYGMVDVKEWDRKFYYERQMKGGEE